MFNVVGHEIEYDGKPFAVIIKPEWADGYVSAAIDALHNLDDVSQYVSVDEIVEVVTPLAKKIHDKFIEAGGMLVSTTGLPVQYHGPLIAAVDAIAKAVAAELLSELRIEVENNADEPATPGA